MHIIALGLCEAPDTAVLACKAAIYLSGEISSSSAGDGCEDDEAGVQVDEDTCPLSPYFAGLAEAFWVTAQRYLSFMNHPLFCLELLQLCLSSAIKSIILPV